MNKILLNSYKLQGNTKNEPLKRLERDRSKRTLIKINI